MCTLLPVPNRLTHTQVNRTSDLWGPSRVVLPMAWYIYWSSWRPSYIYTGRWNIISSSGGRTDSALQGGRDLCSGVLSPGHSTSWSFQGTLEDWLALDNMKHQLLLVSEQADFSSSKETKQQFRYKVSASVLLTMLGHSSCWLTSS